jgi:hypothetical protein
MAIARVRGGADSVGLALRRGRQYLRETSFLARPFSPPEPGELVAWSRILHGQEVLVALNTNGASARGAEITVDSGLHPPGSTMTVRYRSDWSDAELRNPPQGQTISVNGSGGRSTVRVDLPPSGMAILA